MGVLGAGGAPVDSSTFSFSRSARGAYTVWGGGGDRGETLHCRGRAVIVGGKRGRGSKVFRYVRELFKKVGKNALPLPPPR